nr:MAG TPA: ESX-1 secretion-associated regulator [Caudoviricetes sp.]DAH61176.1 MAG TPA: ESX-1 secretion-associated regulator [Caudoviricetes sp.]
MSQTALGKIVSKESIPTIPTIEKICDAFGITLAQFFTKDGIRPDLSAGQLELVETWEYLDDKEREILLTFVRSLQKK